MFTIAHQLGNVYSDFTCCRAYKLSQLEMLSPGSVKKDNER